MLLIVIGIISVVILYLLWRQISFMAKCRNLFHARKCISSETYTKNLGHLRLNNKNYDYLVIVHDYMPLGGLHLHNGEF